MEELADKLVLVQIFLFPHRFLFFLLSFSVSLLHVSATAISRSCYRVFNWSVKERCFQIFEACQHGFAN